MVKQNALFFEDELIDLSYNHSRGFLIEVHIADIHFTAFDPKKQYEILEKECLNKLNNMDRIDLISINGDLFHHKIMNNSDGVLYASLFINKLVDICKKNNATLVLIHGTYQHDADQLKMFYHFLEDPTIDIRIVTTVRFEYIKGAKILCIPELYGLDETIYSNFLFNSGIYDSVFMHGTIKGAIYNDTVGNGRLFCIEDFCNCRGPILSGHVHKSGCFNSYFYYCGSVYRWEHGQEEDKGFLIVLHNLDTGEHYTHFEKVNCLSYITINIDELISEDPKNLIDFINNIKTEKQIDYLRVRFGVVLDSSHQNVIKSYYRNNGNIGIEFLDIEKERSKQLEEEQKMINSEFEFIFDNKICAEEKFCKYVNIKEGYEFINLEKLLSILNEI